MESIEARWPIGKLSQRSRARHNPMVARKWEASESISSWISIFTILLLIGLLILNGTRLSGRAEDLTSEQLTEQEQLERDFTNPLSTLPQLVVRDSWAPANYAPCTAPAPCWRDDQTNQAIFRPLIPRVPPNTLLPIPQLVRPTFALVTVPSSRGGTRTEFGDFPLFDLAVMPWPSPKETGLLWGMGPTFLFPTATSKSAGQGTWEAGPAIGMIYTRIPGLLIGFVAQNPISFSYTRPDVPAQSSFEFQPVFALHLWDKWYIRSAEANWSIGWRHHSSTTLPLSIGLGRTLVRPGLPPMSLFVTGSWMAYRDYAPFAPQTAINFGVTVAFPQLQSLWE